MCKEGEENRQNVAQAYDYSQNSIAKNKPCKKSLKKSRIYILQQFYKSCGWGVNFAEKTHM